MNKISKPLNFALIGASGYVAPRHMQAIRDTGHQLVAAFDPHDSVGVLDSYFPDAYFFTEFERFDRHIDKHRRACQGREAHYISIASPNYLHDSHIRFALRSNAHAICEKPLVLNPWNIDGLIDLERESDRRIYSILQLRLHPSIKAMKAQIESGPKDKKYEIDLTYITSRGRWFLRSWKGDVSKSGGIATNIGVHFYDMLHYLFGNVQTNILHLSDDKKAAGYLEYDQARVRWFLSIDGGDMPEAQRAAGHRTHRSMRVNGEEVDFSNGFVDLHTLSYENILSGDGFGLETNRSAIEVVSYIRTAEVAPSKGELHPTAQALLS